MVFCDIRECSVNIEALTFRTLRKRLLPTSDNCFGHKSNCGTPRVRSWGKSGSAGRMSPSRPWRMAIDSVADSRKGQSVGIQLALKLPTQCAYLGMTLKGHSSSSSTCGRSPFQTKSASEHHPVHPRKSTHDRFPDNRDVRRSPSTERCELWERRIRGP